MKKIFALILTTLALAVSLHAQDARQRTVDTIVGDVLAQMPAQNAASLQSDMLDLAKSAPESIVKLASMLKSADKGENNRIEYAISGLTNFVSTPGNQIWQTAYKTGMQQAIDACTDPVNKQFLASQLALLGKPDNTVVTASIDSKAFGKNATPQEKCQFLYEQEKALGAVPEKDLLNAITDKSRKVRADALRRYAPATDDFAGKVAKKFKSLAPEGKIDVLNWLGDNKIESQLPLVLSQFKTKNGVSDAAVEAAGKIGGDKAADALIAQLGADNASLALKALKSFPGTLNEKVEAALAKAKGSQLDNLVSLAGAKKMRNCSERIFDLAAKGNASALSALAGVSDVTDAGRLVKLLDKATPENVESYSKAFEAATKTMPKDAQYLLAKSAIKEAVNKERFFPALALSGTDAAVEDLVALAKSGSKEAVKALGQTGNYKAAPALLDAARSGNTDALKDYVRYVGLYEKDIDRKCNAFCDALGIASDAPLKNDILGRLAQTPTAKAFAVAGSCLDNQATAIKAAQAVKNIAAKCVDDLDTEFEIETLNRAIKAFEARGTADDGYAVDELKKMISEIPEASPVFYLSEEEQKDGFEVLFDGTNLDKWTGNLEGYRISNNEIYVTAGYGNGGNLYTEKEYRDFVFRFEFSFVRPGANNGIGVRTPHGVDAAFGGMCEVQILDHNDPIYAGWLQDYQVHGSVYGVIPAKRITHKPLGEWNTEEIRVQGDRVTVTVNGEVILDGDVREACQGHNVAPDGGNNNPYTVDHRNHPGMFNEKGYIGFLGHGPGVKFRNVRILDLNSAQKGRKR